MASSKWRRPAGASDDNDGAISRRDILALAALGAVAGVPGMARAAAPQGQLTWGIHVSLAPAWFDPAETSGLITPFMVLYALQDAMVKPMPGNVLTPSLAESYTSSEDGLSYDFVLRDGVKFHNGDPVTAEDVKFSFQRYRGASKDLMASRVAAIETPDPRHVRFKLKDAWPDFLTFYGNATGAGWIVPRKYVEKVGDDGYKKAPIGAGPYKFVSFTPGVELVFEAFEGYWRKTPSVKRLVFRVIPEEATRLAALKRGEIDIAYSIRGELAEEVQHTPGLTLKPVVPASPVLAVLRRPVGPQIAMARRAGAQGRQPRHRPQEHQPGADSRLLASHRQRRSRTASNSSGSRPQPVYDPAKAKQLLAAAGHPGGFDSGEYYCDSSYSNIGRGGTQQLRRSRHPRASCGRSSARRSSRGGEKKYKNVIQLGSGAFGNAATRLAAFIVKGGAYVYGSYPDIDELFAEQAIELDHKKREAMLHKIQQLVYDKSIFAPIWQLAFINGVGPRVGGSGFGLIPGFRLYRTLRRHHDQERL